MIQDERAEPISAAPGGHLPPPGYWQEICPLGDRLRILLITDEVIDGSAALAAGEHQNAPTARRT